MSYPRQTLCLAAMLLCLIFPQVAAHATQQESAPEPPNDSLVRFATDDFFAGAFVDLKALASNERYQKLPLDILSQSNVLLDRFDADVISELALFLGNGEELPSDNQTNETFEIAAAAEIKSSNHLQAAYEMWQATANIPATFKDAGFELISFGDKPCIRCPAGTFLNRRQTIGRLRWLGRDGEPSNQGIDVGTTVPKGYVEGNTQSAAIASFVLPDDKIEQGELRLRLNPTVFRVSELFANEQINAEIYFRKPANHSTDESVQSAPITINVNSREDHVIEFPSKEELPNKQQRVEYLKQFIDNQQIEVVLTCPNRKVYLGLTPETFAISSDQFEYIWIENDNLVVAQSANRLKQMIESAQAKDLSNLAQKLLPDPNEQATLVAYPRNRNDVKSWNNFLTKLQVPPGFSGPSAFPFELEGQLTIDQQEIGKIELKVPKNNPLVGSAIVAKKTILDLAKEPFDQLVEFSRREETRGDLLAMVFPFYCPKYPWEGEGKVRKEFEKKLFADFSHLIKCVEFAKVKGTDNDTLTMTIVEPRFLSNSGEQENWTLHMLQLHRVFNCYNHEQFRLGARLQRRLVERAPAETAAWSRAGHHFSYNISASMDSYRSRYEWTRQGILLLLDGHEQHPESIDLLWQAAVHIAYKIGTSDERLEFRRRFRDDTELHRRLKPYINIELARAPDGQIDSWLVAKLMFEAHIDMRDNGKSSTLNQLYCHLQSPNALFCYARALDEEGQFDGRRERWEVVHKFLVDMGKIKFMTNGEANTFEDIVLGIDLAPFSDDPMLATLPHYHELLIISKIQQQDWVEPIHEKIFSAYQKEREGKFQEASAEYRRARQLLIERPASATNEFTPLLRHYQKAPSSVYDKMFSTLHERSQRLDKQLGKDRSGK